jgi:hypothetical protein
VRIDIVGIRKPISKDDGLEGKDMSPADLFLDQNGIEHESTMIIQGSDEVPCLPQAGISLLQRVPKDDERRHVGSALRHNGLRLHGHGWSFWVSSDKTRAF